MASRIHPTGEPDFWGMARSFQHDWCPRVKGLSPKTVESYRISLENLLSFLSGEMGVSGLEFTLCNQALYYATTITFATLPLLLTAVFFRSRSVALLGIGALVLGLVWSVTWIFAINNRVPDVVRDVGGVLYRLLQFLPPIALILFSSILRKHNITNITVLRRKKP